MDEKEALAQYWKYFRALGNELKLGRLTRSEFVKKYAEYQRRYLLSIGAVDVSD